MRPAETSEEVLREARGPVRPCEKAAGVLQEQVHPVRGAQEEADGDEQGDGTHDGAEGDERQQNGLQQSVSHLTFFR